MKPASATIDDERTYPETSDRATFQHHLARYRFALEQIPEGVRGLDAGCGSGYGTHLLSQKSAFTLGIDYAPHALDYARAHYAGERLAFVAMNCHRLALRNASFDWIVSLELFEHLEHADEFLAECRRVLRPEGRLILSTPNRASWDVHMRSIQQEYEYHINMMDKTALHAALRKHFAEIELYGQWRSGNWLHSTLRALDVFNLRLRLFSPKRREKMQQAMGVPQCGEIPAEAWVFRRAQLNQCNHFVAVCRKGS
jgi:2-polyprenyl-3-methyl-5-hydroxy-6-metoxy-1,4-benzoquinol methylase